jgi:hypothetical protein
MKKLLIILIILLLTACTQTQDYKVPENITYDNDLITWDAIKDAISYKVILNDEETLLDESSFNVSNLPNGEYNILVYAIYEDNTEVFSPFSFTIHRNYTRPMNLSISDHILSFDSSYLTAYQLFINDILITTFNTTSIDLSTYTELYNTYNIKVVAIYDGLVYPSETLIYNTHIKLDLDQEMTYELRSSEEISFDFDHLDQIIRIEKNQTIIADTLYSATTTSLIFDQDLFFYPSYGINTYEVYTNSGYFLITITVIETERPHLYSSSSVNYQSGQDITLEFNLLGGSFIKVEGNDISNQDYTFDDELLIINDSYVESILESNPDRSTIILSYQLEKDQNSFTGLIFIYIN